MLGHQDELSAILLKGKTSLRLDIGLLLSFHIQSIPHGDCIGYGDRAVPCISDGKRLLMLLYMSPPNTIKFSTISKKMVLLSNALACGTLLVTYLRKTIKQCHCTLL